MEAIRITAYLYSGFVSSDPWSPSIDGILAYWAMRERLGPEDFALRSSQPHLMQPVEGLPMEVRRHGDAWWYVCSSPIVTACARARRYAHRRFDDAHERHLELGAKSGKVLTAAGPFKNVRNSFLITVADRIEWHVVGDRLEIERLLHRCGHVGAKVGSGFGRVRQWAFDAGEEQVAHTRRPLPINLAPTRPAMTWGLVPPVRLTKIMCGMP